MQYLLSVIDDTAALATPDEWKRLVTPSLKSRTLDAFNDRLVAEGYWVFAGGLAAPGTATVIDNRGGEALFTDGPFVESKEHLGGLWIIEAADLDVALKLRRRGVEGLQPEGRGAAVRVTGGDVQEAISRLSARQRAPLGRGDQLRRVLSPARSATRPGRESSPCAASLPGSAPGRRNVAPERRPSPARSGNEESPAECRGRDPHRSADRGRASPAASFHSCGTPAAC